MSARSRALAAAASAALLLSLSACGSSSSSSDETREAAEKPDMTATPVAQVTGTPSDAKVIAITLKDGTTNPSGAQVSVRTKQPIVLDIDADKAGQIHVHSTPEHQIAFPEGESQVTLEIDRPGIVDVEDHALDQLILQLEVS